MYVHLSLWNKDRSTAKQLRAAKDLEQDIFKNYIYKLNLEPSKVTSVLTSISLNKCKRDTH